MNLKIIPIAQVIIVAVSMLLIKLSISTGHIDGEWKLSLSALLSAIGIGLVFAGGNAFIKSKTTVNPMRPEDSSALVVKGIYRISRNPMYLGFVVILLAWGVFLGSALAFLMLPIFVWYIRTFQILPEEKALEDNFGENYKVYKSKVRRWI